MTVGESAYIQPATHEASRNLLFTDVGLSPSYGLHAVTRGQNYGDPVTGTFLRNGTRYLAALKPKSSGLKLRDHPSFEFETVKEFALRVEPAPAESFGLDDNLGGVTFTASPRWPNRESFGDSPNPSTPDVVGVNVRFDVSNYQ